MAEERTIEDNDQGQQLEEGCLENPQYLENVEKADFETAFERLQEIVTELERGDIKLERALELFEEGVGLVKHCVSVLDKAETRIKRLLQDEMGRVVAELIDWGEGGR